MTPSFRSVAVVRFLACCRFETLIFVTFGLGFGPASSRGVKGAKSSCGPSSIRTLGVQRAFAVGSVFLVFHSSFVFVVQLQLVHSFSQIRCA